MKVEKSRAKLYQYRDDVETAVKGVSKSFGSDDSGNAAMRAPK